MGEVKMRGVNDFSDIKKIYSPDGNQCIRRGDMYYIDKGAVTGSEQAAGRPAVVIGNDTGNEKSPVVIIVYTTSQKKPHLPTHVEVNTLPEKSTVLCEQIVTVSKERLGDYINRVTEEELEQIDKALAVSIDLKKYSKPDIKLFESDGNPLLEEALRRINEIIGTAKKVRQIEDVLSQVNAGSVCFFGDGITRLDGIVGQAQLDTLKGYAVKQIELGKATEEERIKALLGADSKPPAQINNRPPAEPKIQVEDDKPKAVYLTKEVKKRIEELYESGKEMEDIAAEVGIDMVRLSRHINKSGLAQERYKGQWIPSTGSAPIPSASVGLTGRKK